MISQTCILILLIIVVIFLLSQGTNYENFDNTAKNNLKFAKKINDSDKNINSDSMLPFTIIHPDSYLLDDGSAGLTGLHTNLCSKACCSSQYPLPFDLKYDSAVCANKDNFVPNNIMCSNAWQDSGCLCLTKDQAKNLYNRGGNA